MPEEDTDRKDKAFFVGAAEIRDQGYDLSINRYKEAVYEEVEYDHPKMILAKLAELEEIAKGREELGKDVGMNIWSSVKLNKIAKVSSGEGAPKSHPPLEILEYHL